MKEFYDLLMTQFLEGLAERESEILGRFGGIPIIPLHEDCLLDFTDEELFRLGDLCMVEMEQIYQADHPGRKRLELLAANGSINVAAATELGRRGKLLPREAILGNGLIILRDDPVH